MRHRLKRLPKEGFSTCLPGRARQIERALSFTSPGRSRHFLSLFSAAMLGYRAGDGKPLEKQVAMIAQKIVEAKHTQQKRRRLVTTANP
jgi:hypothetical protein